MAQWFRFYNEALNDPKVQRLSPELFKHWVNLLCMASLNDGIIPEMEDVSFQLRVTPSDALAVTEALEEKGLIDRVTNQHSTIFMPHNWKKRQYKSDTSTQRVKQYRKRKRNVSCNVSVTTPETETDTDIKIEAKASTKKVSRGSRLPDDWRLTPDLVSFAIDEGFDLQEAHREGDKFRDYWLSATGSNSIKKRWDLAFKNWIRSAAERRFKPQAQTKTKTENILETIAEVVNERDNQNI